MDRHISLALVTKSPGYYATFITTRQGKHTPAKGFSKEKSFSVHEALALHPTPER